MKKAGIYKYLIFAILSAFLLSGCAGAQIKHAEEVSRLEAQIKQLENEIALKDKRQKETEKQLQNEIQLRRSLDEKIRDKEDAKGPMSIIGVQKALKNAGFNPGPIDGKMGARTKAAIIEFQKANGLEPDGKVGPKTWARLQGFL